MKLHTALAALFLVGATGMTSAQSPGYGYASDPASAKYPHTARDLAATCANCHGTDGRAIAGADSLAGEPADKIFKTVMDFRSGDKPATIMHQIAKGYTEEQIRLIANYFASQK